MSKKAHRVLIGCPHISAEQRPTFLTCDVEHVLEDPEDGSLEFLDSGDPRAVPVEVVQLYCAPIKHDGETDPPVCLCFDCLQRQFDLSDEQITAVQNVRPGQEYTLRGRQAFLLH